MPATNQIQIARIIEAVSRKFYQSGVTPDLYQILSKVSEYFAKNPPGLPVAMDTSAIIDSGPSNVDVLNTLLANTYYNLSVLYDTAIVQINETLLENTILSTRINQISKRQTTLLTQINDYLFSLYNTGGYYFSISDNFATTDKTDLSLTSAFVDTTNQLVSIPLLGSGFSNIIPSSIISSPTIQVTDGNNNTLNYTTISPFNFATSGTNNIAWEIQVSQPSPGPVSVNVFIPFNPPDSSTIELSQISVTPYSIVPFQLYALVGTNTTGSNTPSYTTFGNNIVTSSSTVNFSGDTVNATAVQLVMNKTANQYDFQTTVNSTLQYVYVFGAQDITFTQQVYDNTATFVSQPLSMLSSSSNIIDAVALEVTDNVPAGTAINYYVSIDNPNGINLSDFNWQSIVPTTTTTNNASNIVQFNGAYINQEYIRAVPRSSTDLQLTPINTTSSNPATLNPNPLIIPGVDTYILTDFTDTFLPNSMVLEEGVNSTRIYYLVESNLPETTTFWANVINNNSPSTPSLTYGEIDVGNGFFYGGDLSSDPTVAANNSGISLFVETYLYIDSTIPPVLDNFYKADSASQTWDVSVYLNGALLSSMPGANTTTTANFLTPISNNLLTWNFQEGVNHIALIINIPSPSEVDSSVPTPYLGTVNILQNNPLYNLGTVKLSDWSYVSFFDLEYNQPGTPASFTVYNGQIITKHVPTTNFGLTYATQSGLAPSALRFRADLQRSINNPTLTPQLNTYSLRFLYGSGT